MKHLIFLGLLLTALICVAPIAFKHDEQAYANLKAMPRYTAKNSTVLLETKRGYGTGIIVTVDHTNYVWTVAHVVANEDTVDVYKTGETWHLKANDVKVKLNSGEETDAEVIAFSLMSDSRDLALLRIKQRDWTTNSVTFYHGAPPEIGTPVFHIGNFFGPKYHHSYSAGVVSYINRVTEEDKGTYDQVSIMVLPGSSGGGVFLEGGAVIGLADAMVPATELGLIIPVRVLEEWAREKNVLYALP